MKNKALGVIGGMGPEASSKFYEMLISYAQTKYKVKKNEEFPEIYLASIPVPDFISNQRKQNTARDMILDRIGAMDKLDIRFYCMACNTGHLLLDDIRKVTKKPFVSLLEVLPKHLKEEGVKSVGILATPTTIKTKMYDCVLANSNITAINPRGGELEVLGKIIKETVAGKNRKENTVLIQEIAKSLLDRGAEGLLLACTELPMIFPKQALVPTFDTLEILALSVLERYYGKKVKKNE